MLKSGVHDVERTAREIAAMLGDRPLSVEVTTNEPAEMLQQARRFAGWANNVVVKIPVINEQGEPCLDVVGQLRREGIRVNVTACLSFGQAMLAVKAEASYVSIFAGRIADEGNDASVIVRATRSWINDWGYDARIIVGSIRGVIDIQQAALAGAHVVTVAPDLLLKLVDHKYSRETVRQFVADARAASETIARLSSTVR